MTISAMILPEFEEEMKSTRKMLERIPEDKPEYAPHEKSMKLARLAGHIAELPGWVRETMKQDELVIKPGEAPYTAPSRQHLLDTFDKNVADARALIATATDDHLQKIWTLKFGQQVVFSIPRYAVIRTMVMNHLIHHRSQLGGYLRLNEIEVPGMYGPSADEMKFWTADTAK